MPAFLDANNLQPFVGEDLVGVLKQIDYIEKNDKTKSSGYNALILPLICKVYLDARSTVNPSTNKPYLVKSQEPLARASEIVLISLSKVGIIALMCNGNLVYYNFYGVYPPDEILYNFLN